jgi:hypothetical protein
LLSDWYRNPPESKRITCALRQPAASAATAIHVPER